MLNIGKLSAAIVVGIALTNGHQVNAQSVQPVSASDQVKDDLFAGTEKFAAGAKDINEVNMDQKTLGMMSGSGKHADMAKKMDFVVVHSYSYDKPGMYKLSDVAVYRQKLTDGSWSCMVHTQSKDGSTDVCMRTGPDHESNEMVVITAEPKELTFVHLKGRMSLADLGSMGNMGGPASPTPPPTPRPR